MQAIESTGFLDFLVHDREDPFTPQWALEFLVDGSNAEEHANRFLSHGAYTTRTLGVCRKSIQRWPVARTRPRIPCRKARPDRRRLDTTQEQAILGFVDSKPGQLQDQIVDFVDEQFGIKISQPTK